MAHHPGQEFPVACWPSHPSNTGSPLTLIGPLLDEANHINARAGLRLARNASAFYFYAGEITEMTLWSIEHE